MSLSNNPSDTSNPLAEGTVPHVAHVSVKLPPFWKTSPALWFLRLESQFALANITSDLTKFNNVISCLDSDVLNSVSDILMKPPTTGKYDALKQRLISIHSESETSKIRTLLQGLELGDQRPSQLLTRMRALAGDTVGEALLRSLWLARLPYSTQSVLAAFGEDNLSKVAEVADKISDLTSPSYVNSTNVIPQSSESATARLELQVAQLTQQVSELSSALGRSSRSPSRGFRRSFRRNRSRDNSRNYKERTNDICFYHVNFGDRARKCQSPCFFRQSGN